MTGWRPSPSPRGCTRTRGRSSCVAWAATGSCASGCGSRWPRIPWAARSSGCSSRSWRSSQWASITSSPTCSSCPPGSSRACRGWIGARCCTTGCSRSSVTSSARSCSWRRRTGISTCDPIRRASPGPHSAGPDPRLVGYAAAVTAPTTDQATRAGRNLVAGVLLGLGTVAFIDETVFHQLLHWHHFYDRSTTEVGLVSDGLFHAFSWFATVAALFLVADLRRDRAFWGRRFLAGWLAGAGFFQLYDGLVQHKLFGLHQIRYGVDLVPYDVAWIVIASGLLLAGLGLIASTGRAVRQPA